jgi:hypothetical protein
MPQSLQRIKNLTFLLVTAAKRETNDQNNIKIK